MIELLGYAALGYWAARWFSPLQAIKDWYFEKFPFRYDYVFYCPKCVTFWGTLIYTENIFSAVISSLLAYMITFVVAYMDSKWPE